VEEIARRVDANPDGVHRLLRLLSSYSIFVEVDGRFALTEMADALRADVPNSLRGIALLMGDPRHWEEWSLLTESVRTGDASTPKLRGMSIFEYFDVDTEYRAAFFGGMGNLSALETQPVAAAYDFSGFDTIVDVGGGGGALLAAVLQRAGTSHGIVFDDPSATAGAAATLAEAGVADRCAIEAGSYFESVPAGGDAYLLKHIVHDWPESTALEILKNVRAAIRPTGSLFLMEFVLPDGDDPHIGKLVDLWLMLLVGGRERTSAQYSQLLEAAGFRLHQVVRTESPVSIIEARPR